MEFSSTPTSKALMEGCRLEALEEVRVRELGKEGREGGREGGRERGREGGREGGRREGEGWRENVYIRILFLNIFVHIGKQYFLPKIWLAHLWSFAPILFKPRPLAHLPQQVQACNDSNL